MRRALHILIALWIGIGPAVCFCIASGRMVYAIEPPMLAVGADEHACCIAPTIPTAPTPDREAGDQSCPHCGVAVPLMTAKASASLDVDPFAYLLPLPIVELWTEPIVTPLATIIPVAPRPPPDTLLALHVMLTC